MPPKSCLVSRQVFLGLQEQKRAKDSCIAKALPNLGARNALPVALHSLPVAQVQSQPSPGRVTHTTHLPQPRRRLCLIYASAFPDTGP